MILDLEKIAPRAKPEFRQALENSITTLQSQFLINNRLRWCHFFAQTAHESANFTVFIENLNYSSARLLIVFPKYFPDFTVANQYDRNPEKIANKVYGNRMGNNAFGDGWKYRGRGLIQLTGKSNYEQLEKSINKDVVNNPDYVATYEGAIISAAWFWYSKNLNTLADKDDCLVITKAINGGVNGFTDRMAKLQKYKTIINS